MALAVNETYFRDSRLRMEAEGYQFGADGNPALAADGMPDRNGGLVAMRRVELAQDNWMFRIASQKDLKYGGLPNLLNSPWWMEEDRMRLLLDRARTAGVGLSEMGRRQLALPVAPGWTDADIIVSVRIRPGIVIAALAGRGRTAAAGGDRRIVAPEAPHLFMDQLYLPGLGKPGGDRAKGMANANAWFDTATAKSYDPMARGYNPR
ncbi:hypothetical protein [Roseococcus sp. YIM B11640]|uniref:hypothetical protein n=1 Tax=Roseococcus sp. YIM B11640 TaxID=3133973 RepID=UPI003C7B4884